MGDNFRLINSYINLGHNTTHKSTEKSLTENVGFSFLISDTLVGKGAYGEVYLATDEKSRKVAIKCCKIGKNGIPNILEASIMASICHPYLNRALRIYASDSKLYIVQELALMDLNQYTRRDKDNNKPSLSELKRWCFCIATAVQCLHNQGIIHGDIKAGNILLYEDGSVKLADYTLSIKKWNKSNNFTHNVCTYTHRPLECLLHGSWNESLDIWSLGCTFYELAYGELLFPSQCNLEPSCKTKEEKNQFKTRLRYRCINNILDWAKYQNEVIDVNYHIIDYISYALCSDYHNSSMTLFNSLIIKMLTVNSDFRPSIDQILDHSFFNGLISPVYLNIIRPSNHIPVPEYARVTRYIQKYTDNIDIQKIAFSIYSRCVSLHEFNEALKATTCTWIASKLIPTSALKLSLDVDQLIPIEREICHNLGFKLHDI
jgi:serine/threonine protein kinase